MVFHQVHVYKHVLTAHGRTKSRRHPAGQLHSYVMCEERLYGRLEAAMDASTLSFLSATTPIAYMHRRIDHSLGQ